MQSSKTIKKLFQIRRRVRNVAGTWGSGKGLGEEEEIREDSARKLRGIWAGSGKGPRGARGRPGRFQNPVCISKTIKKRLENVGKRYNLGFGVQGPNWADFLGPGALHNSSGIGHPGRKREPTAPQAEAKLQKHHRDGKTAKP